MATTIDNKSVNKTVVLMRRLVSEKKATKKQLREALSTDIELQKAIAELDNRHVQANA